MIEKRRVLLHPLIFVAFVASSTLFHFNIAMNYLDAPFLCLDSSCKFLNKCDASMSSAFAKAAHDERWL